MNTAWRPSPRCLERTLVESFGHGEGREQLTTAWFLG